MVALQPRLAEDAAIDLAPVVRGVTDKNYKSRKTAIFAALQKATTGKLAADADVDDVVELLDALQQIDAPDIVQQVAGGGDPAAVADPAGNENDDEADPDPDDAEGVMAFLEGKLSPEDLAKVKAMMGADPAMDDVAEVPETGKPESIKKLAGDKKVAKDTTTLPLKPAATAVTKTAMDAALATTKQQVIAEQRAIRAAEREVSAWVGELAFDEDVVSADDIYGRALETLGVATDGVPPEAWPHILRAQPLPNARAKRSTVAMDAASSKSFADRFPGAASISVM